MESQPPSLPELPDPNDLLPRIPEPYDSGWKRVLYRFFFEVIDFFFPTLGVLIDRSVAPVFLDTELKQISPGGTIGHRRTDALVKVQLVSGAEQILYCHLELQTKDDHSIGGRSFVYAFRIYEKFGNFPITLVHCWQIPMPRSDPRVLNSGLRSLRGTPFDFCLQRLWIICPSWTSWQVRIT